jgi:aspartyl-tRNA(Asn)/glutamyl-tRNA(Gln) amidotransferase subunit A
MTTASHHPADWSLVETVDAIKQKRISALEVAEASLQRITERRPVINCFIRVDEERTIAQARLADAAIAAKRETGPLHGAILGHKDMYYRAGFPVTCGSAIRRAFVPDITATVLDKLDNAGGVDVGALNMSEFASGPTGHNEHWGHCRNPWNPAHITGGSSTGSGSAVGGRVVHASLGSDTGGSIRLPAGICGVYGIKATQGRVSRHGVMGLSFSLDNVGPLARTARDCARMLKAIAGADPMDTTALNVPVADYEADLHLGVKGLRIAVPTNYYWDDMDPEIGAALENVLAVYEKAGALVSRVTLPHHDVIGGLAGAVSASEQCTLHEHWVKTCPERYAPLVRARMQAGFGFTAVEYLKALQMRAGIAQDVVQAGFAAADVLFMPLLRFPVPTLDETDVKDGPNIHTVLGRINHCTRPLNYLGLPGLTVPAGFSRNGLPVAFQLVGRPFQEKMLFRVAEAFERETHVPDTVPVFE